MKNVLLGAIAVGVAYLAYCQYKHKKCGCAKTAAGSGATTPASTASTSDTGGGGTERLAPDVPSAPTPALAANGGDGFGKRYF